MVEVEVEDGTLLHRVQEGVDRGSGWLGRIT